MLKIEKPDASTLYSVTANAGIINIHPFTDLITRNWFKVRGYSVEVEFNKEQPASLLPTANDIVLIETTIKQIVNLALSEFNLTNAYELFTDAFVADSTGFDEFLDHMEVKIRYDKIDVTLKNSNTGFNATFIDDIDLNTDFTIPDTLAPTKPTGLVAIPANSTSILVAWNASTDNIGVAGYNIYRDGVKIARSPYPLYSDTGLSVKVLPYCYKVEAFDGTGNVSVETEEVCTSLLASADTTAPAPATSLLVVAQGSSSISLSWAPSIDNDVLAYSIYSGTAGNVTIKIATAVATNYLDLDPVNFASTCYKVVAFDAALNSSIESSEVCAGTVSDIAAPTTTASLLGGTYTTAQTVFLTCDDGLYDSGCSTTYYTLDDSVPTTLSTKYTGPITISESTVLRFISVDNAGKVEVESNPANRQVYTIDSGGAGLVPGVEFSSSIFVGTEAGATAVITVRRNGDATSSASVDYSLADGSAIVDEDYTSVAGTLTWAAGDATSKTFYVPIKGDNITDVNESVLLSLTNPVNTTFATNQNATLVIQDVECNGFISLNITVDTVIAEPCTVVSQNIQVNNNAKLTISPGSTLIFLANAGINVSSGSYLRANGTAKQPILFTGQTKTPGFWAGIDFYNSSDVNNILNYVTVEYGGSPIIGTNSNIRLYDASSVSLTNSTLSYSSGYGLEIRLSATLNAFNNNTITANALHPVKIKPDLVGRLDAESFYSGNGIDSIYVFEQLDSIYVTTTQTWRLLDVPYSVRSVYVGSFSPSDANTVLTIEPGVELKFQASGFFQVNGIGTIVAKGTASAPIVFTSDNATPSPGDWDGIFIFGSNNSNFLDNAIVEYGGGASHNSNIYLGESNNTTLNMTNAISRYSSGYGLRTYNAGAAAFPSFSNNTFTNNTLQPLRIPINNVDILDSSTSLTGNSIDEVYIDTIGIYAGVVRGPLTIPRIDINYSMNRIQVTSVLTIDPGVNITMRNDGTFIGNISVLVGSLTAIGTPALPITIKGAVSPQAGYWDGIQFFNTTTGNLSYVTVSDAGIIGDISVGFGNITVSDNSVVNIENCTITDSATHGIGVLLSSGATLNGDMSTNTFTNINTAGGYADIFNF